MESIKPRAQNLIELAQQAEIYRNIRPIQLPLEEITKMAADQKESIGELTIILDNLKDWTQENIDTTIKEFLTQKNIKLGKIGPLLRLILTGKTSAPSISEVFFALGHNESLLRLKDFI